MTRLSMHDAAFRFYAEVASQITDESYSVVEFGSVIINGNYAGTIRSLFPRFNKYVGIDIIPGEGVDIVISAADWEPDQQYDIVICAEVYEHTPLWPEITAKAAEALRPGGLYIGSCASRDRPDHSFDGEHVLKPGEYYANVNKEHAEPVFESLFSTYDLIEADGYFGNDDLYWKATK